MPSNYQPTVLAVGWPRKPGRPCWLLRTLVRSKLPPRVPVVAVAAAAGAGERTEEEAEEVQ